MKKLIPLLIAAVAVLLLLVGCSEATVHGKLEIYSDLSGTKTLTFRIFGDQEPLPGRDYTPGNNTSFMLSKGDDLIRKLEEFCPVDGVVFTYEEGASNTVSTYVTMSFDFENIEDYNRKGRLIAGKYADGWQDAQCTESGGTVTVREADGNLKLLYMDMLEKYFNDFDCYPVYEYGPSTQSQVIPHGVQFLGDDYFAFSWWFVPASNEIVVGKETVSASFFDPETDHEARADLSASFLEASGVPAAPVPKTVPVSISVGPNTKTVYEQNEAYTPGTLIVKYSDGTEKTVPLTEEMIGGFDSSVSGTYKVAVRHLGLETSFDLTVKSAVRPQHWFLIGLGILVVVGGVTAVLMARKRKVSK